MKTKRQAELLRLIKENDITTQGDILKMLSDSGFTVTQATVSRDIKELRIHKVPGKNGQYKYSAAQQDSADFSDKYDAIFTQSVLNADMSGNIVVLKCYVGMAQAACAAIDAMHFDGVIGTIAGDDTIFALCRSPHQAQSMVDDTLKLVKNKY